MTYRKELDGLRALAVMAVIFYHSHMSIKGIPIFSGGLFGVDIFFVLSGYLITGIIREKIENNAFSFSDFYIRRAKRIIPALIVILTIFSVAAYIFLLPEEMITYAQSLKSALGFYSNYFFYGEDSYIATASIYKPLLHTWSLSVECQFYLLYPVLIWFICKYFKPHLFVLLLALTLFSFLYAVSIAPNYPNKAFYLLPSRVWELLAGGLVTFFNYDKLTHFIKHPAKRILVKTIPALGLSLVGYSFLFMHDKMTHPSFITLLPVIGTCLIIMFAHKEELTTKLLSLKPIVWTGLISYSLYLWHQPVFVFFRLCSNNYPGKYKIIILMLSIFCFICAWITYQWVEKPFRTYTLVKWKPVFLIVLGVGCFSFSVMTIEHQGFSNQIATKIKKANEIYKIAEFRKLENREKPGINFAGNTQSLCNMRRPDTACRFGDESWVLLGDSFAGHYEPELLKMLKLRKHGLISFCHEVCPLVSTDLWFANQPVCSIANEMRWQEINAFTDKKNIIIAANYNLFLSPKKRVENPMELNKKWFSGGEKADPELAWRSYAENIIKLLDKGHTVYVIYPLPEGLRETTFFRQFRGINKFRADSTEDFHVVWKKSASTYYKDTVKLSDKLDSYLPDHPRLHKIKPLDILCQNGKCLVVNKEGPLYSGGHLSYIGAKEILQSFIH